MSSIRTTFAGAAAAVGSSAALLLGGVTPVANADPAPPLPIDALQAPGLSAVQSIGPAIQQAAADPTNAASTLMAAAAVFAGDAAVPPDSKNVATAVNQFVAHVPAAGAVPGAEAHLPAGVDPAHAVGPAPEAAPVAAPAPEAVPAADPAAAPGTRRRHPLRHLMPPRPRRPQLRPRSVRTPRRRRTSCTRRSATDAWRTAAMSWRRRSRLPVRRRSRHPDRQPARRPTCSPRSARPAPAAEQKLPLNVTWVNLTTGKSGSATLKPRPDINPDGPTTLTAIVDTGSGSIISTIFGQVTTTEKQCQFMPTIGSTVVP